MIKNSLPIAVLMLCVLFWGRSLHAQFTPVNTGAIGKPVVVELFTSQGCSSCPPADALLTQLSHNPNIIPLSFHVTYWDSPRIQNPLSHEFATDRQKRYQRALSTRNLFTPQMIVNGKVSFVGTNRGDLQNALKSAKPLHRIDVRKMGAGAIEITLPDLPDDQYLNYTLTLVGVKAAQTMRVERGENRGKTITYTNAVNHIQPLGSWIGNPARRVISLPPGVEIEQITVLAQAGGYGEIVAAGRM
ncbi:MAG: DUF1223 domain-containing protein [Alphaproteobacteria bacterium]